MVYVSNAFSLQMVGAKEVYLHVAPITVEEVRKIIDTADGFTSAIGHADTAAVVSDMLGKEVAFNRINVSLEKGDILVVAQIMGGRLPEGSTTLPDGFTIQFMKVELM